MIDFWCFNATFNNISAISWQPVLVVEEAGVPRENHHPWASTNNILNMFYLILKYFRIKQFSLHLSVVFYYIIGSIRKDDLNFFF
jgi:hypothetical protein